MLERQLLCIYKGTAKDYVQVSDTVLFTLYTFFEFDM